MPKKLWTVTIECQYAVVAETEREAKEYADSALYDVSYVADLADARETTSMIIKGVERPLLPDGWESDCLVYGEEITFDEAWQKYGKKKSSSPT